MRLHSGTIFELEETGIARHVGTPFEGYVSWNGTFPAVLDKTQLTRHTWTIYCADSPERYDTNRHWVKQVYERHVWVGKLLATGDPATIMTAEGLSAAAEDMLNLGVPLRIKVGAQSNAEHDVLRAELLGERIEFDSSLNGFHLSSVTDPFGVTSSGEIGVDLGDGVASVSASVSTSSTNPSSAAWVEFETDHLPAMNWMVNFRPRDVTGAEITGKKAIVVLGEIMNSQVLGSHQERAKEMIKYVDLPYTGLMSLPRERQRTYRRVQCFSNYSGSPNFRNESIDVTETVEEVVWSRRNSVGVAMSKTAFGLATGSILDDLNATGSVNWAAVESWRRAKARFCAAAGATHVRRADVRLIPRASFATNDWIYFPPSAGSVAVGSNVLAAPPTASRQFESRFGQTGSTSVKFFPYRFAELDIETEEDAVTLLVKLESFGGPGFGGTKEWLVTVVKGRRIVKIDLKDPDLVNDRVRDLLPLAVDRNPMEMVYSPGNETDFASRFEGFNLVYKLLITVPADQSITFHEFGLAAESATLLAGQLSMGGTVDHGDHWRTLNDSAVNIVGMLGLQRCLVQNLNWGMDPGWLIQYQGPVSCMDASFNLRPDIDLIAGGEIYSTATSALFVNYWGMTDGPMFGGSFVQAAFEYIQGNLITAVSIPRTESAVKLSPLPPPDRQFSTPKTGLVIHPEPSAIRTPPATGNVTAVALGHPIPRTEVFQWAGNTNGRWSSIQFDPRGAGKSGPSRDRNAGQRHVRATVQDGTLVISRKGNFDTDGWLATRTTIRCEGACARIHQHSKEQWVYILLEQRRRIWLYRCELGKSDVEPVIELGAGEYPAMTIFPDGRKCCYWIAGDALIGVILSGTDEIAVDQFVVATGVQALHLSAAMAEGPGGQQGVWLAVAVSGNLRHLHSGDGVRFVQRGPDMTFAREAEVVDTRAGRRFIYTVPDGSTDVWVEIRGQDGQIILPAQVAYSGVDPGTKVGARHAVTAGGQLYIAMSVVVEGAVRELRSLNGISFS